MLVASARSADPGSTGAANVFVNDPCLDPPPTAPFPLNFFRTVQSETEIAVLNDVRRHDDEDDEDDDDDDDDEGDDDDDDDGGNRERNSSGRLMVAGYNDSYGFYDNRQGVSGFSYSTDGGRQWIDAGGLPPAVPSGAAVRV